MASTAFSSLLPQLVPFPVPALLESALARVFGLDRIEELYRTVRGAGDGHGVADRVLEALEVDCITAERDLERIPRTGAAVLTVNHPFGILEGAVLAKLLSRVRPDVRFLANGAMATVPEIRHLLIEVDPVSGRTAASGNSAGMRHALRHLLDKGLLVIFPAGAVSTFRWQDRGVADADWNPVVARLVELAARRGVSAQVVPAHIDGANSALFHAAGLVHRGLRTALLARELLNKRGRRVEVRIGTPVAADKLLAMGDAAERMRYLRWRTYLLAGRNRFQPRTARPLARRGPAVQAEVAAAVAADALAEEVAALPAECLLSRAGELEVYIAAADRIPALLREIGRLREITFRAAGEGSGKALDLDAFDARYQHLFVWNARAREVVGAYRLANTEDVGLDGLYTATLFRYDSRFLDKLGPAVELGRSFVRQEYQRGFAPLLLLWKGIGRYVARNPRAKVLFGPVSISNRYQAISRDLMVSFLERFAGLEEWAGLVRNRRGFRDRVLRRAQAPAFPRAGFDIEDLSAVVADLEPDRTGVPVLLRQYLKLGGRLLSFNVDPEFSDALDGLILVDLTRTETKLLERYLGKAEAAALLQYHQKGHDCAH